MVITELLSSAVKDIANDTKLMKKSAILYQDKFYSVYQSIHMQFQKDWNPERCLFKKKKDQAVLKILWKLYVLCGISLS